jgi:hypothetical protein
MFMSCGSVIVRSNPPKSGTAQISFRINGLGKAKLPANQKSEELSRIAFSWRSSRSHLFVFLGYRRLSGDWNSDSEAGYTDWTCLDKGITRYNTSLRPPSLAIPSNH